MSDNNTTMKYGRAGYSLFGSSLLASLQVTTYDNNYDLTDDRNESSWQIDHLQHCLQLSQHDPTLYSFLHHLNVFVLVPVCAAGVALNLLALFFLHRPPKISSGVLIYLNVLLVVDICQLITTATQVIPYRCDFAMKKSDSWYDFCFFYRHYAGLVVARLVATADTIQMWSMAALAAHRYWKIARPVVSRMKDTIGRASVFMFSTTMLAILFRVPMFCELQLHYSRPLNRTVVGINHQLVRTYWYNIGYYAIANSVLYHLTPFTAMTAFSWLTVRAIRQRAKRRHHTNKRETRATVSILSIVVFFLIFHVLSLYEMIRRWHMMLGFSCQSSLDFILVEFSVLLAMISSSLNALIFIAVTNKVKAYLEVIIRKASRLSSGGSSETTATMSPLSPRTPKSTLVESTSLTRNSYRTRLYSDTAV